MSLPETYTVAQVAQAMQCSEWFVREQVKKGIVRPIRLGSNGQRAPMRFTDEHIETMLRAMTPTAPTPRRRRIA